MLKKFNLSIWMGLIALLIITMVVGCASQVVQENGVEENGVEEKTFVVGFTVPYLDKFDTPGLYERAILDFLDDKGLNYEFIGRAPDGGFADHAGQLSIIEDLITLEVDFVCFFPTDITTQVPSFEALMAAEIPFLIFDYFDFAEDSELPEYDKVHFIGYSQEQAGIAVADFIKENYPPGTKMVLIRGIAGLIDEGRMARDLHIENGMDIIYEHRAEFSRERAYHAIQDIMITYPETEIALVANSAMASGVITALQGMELIDEVDVFGAGGTIEELQAIVDGNMRAMFVRDHFEIGEEAGKIIYEYANGRGGNVPRVINVSAYVISSLDDILNLHDVRYQEMLDIPGQ